MNLRPRSPRRLVPLLVAIALGCGPEELPEVDLPAEPLAPDAPELVQVTALDASRIASVRASGEEGANAAAAVMDGRMDTRWAGPGPGAWLEADLGEVRPLESFDIAWHRGDLRTSAFRIEVSADGARYQDVFSGSSSGRTLVAERYAFARTEARFVRVVVEGNSENGWAGITELAAPLAAAELPQGGCVPTGEETAPVRKVSASAHEDLGGEAGPLEAVDGDLSTRWACLGEGCWLRVDLGRTRQLAAVQLAWHRAEERSSRYVVAVSEDGVSYTDVASGRSARKAGLQRVELTAAAGRYIRVTVNGNTQDTWASLAELTALASTGCDGTPTRPEPAPALVARAPAPAEG